MIHFDLASGKFTAQQPSAAPQPSANPTTSAPAPSLPTNPLYSFIPKANPSTSKDRMLEFANRPSENKKAQERAVFSNAISSDPRWQQASEAERSFYSAQASGHSSDDYLNFAQKQFDSVSSARDELNRQLDELKRQEIRSYDIYTGKSSIDNSAKIDDLTKQLETIQRQYDRYEKELGFANRWKQEDDDKAWVREHHDDYGSYNGVYGATVRSIEQLSAERDRLKALLKPNFSGSKITLYTENPEESDNRIFGKRDDGAERRAADEHDSTARQLEMIERALADMQRRQQLAQYMLTEDDDATESIHRGQKAIEAADLENAATANARYDRAMGDESIANQLGGEGSVDYEGFRMAQDQARANKLDVSYKRPTEQWNYDERATFYILADRYGIKAASDYAAQVNTAHNNAAASEKTKAWEEAGRGMPTDGGRNPLTTVGNFGVGALGVAGQVALAPVHAISWADKLITSLKQEGYYTGRANPWLTDYANAYTAGRARGLNEDYGTISKAVPIVGGKGLGDLYQLGISTAQSLAYGNLAGEAATLAIFFGQAADTSFDEAINMGMSAEQATVYSALSGAAEVIGEKISLDNLLNADAAATRSLIKNILIQGGIEGSEEAFTDLLNIFGDAIAAEVSGGRSKRERELEAYMQQGMSYDDAQKQLVKDFLKEAAADAIGGAISGGFSGFIQNLKVSVSQYTATKQAKRQFTKEYNTAVKTGEFSNFDTGKLSAMYQFAQKNGDQQTQDKIIAELTNRVFDPNDVEPGKDLTAAKEELAKIIKASIEDAVSRRENKGEAPAPEAPADLQQEQKQQQEQSAPQPVSESREEMAYEDMPFTVGEKAQSPAPSDALVKSAQENNGGASPIQNQIIESNSNEQPSIHASETENTVNDSTEQSASDIVEKQAPAQTEEEAPKAPAETQAVSSSEKGNEYLRNDASCNISFHGNDTMYHSVNEAMSDPRVADSHSLEDVVRAKFQQNRELRQKLFATGDQSIDPGTEMGAILESVRDELRAPDSVFNDVSPYDGAGEMNFNQFADLVARQAQEKENRKNKLAEMFGKENANANGQSSTADLGRSGVLGGTGRGRSAVQAEADRLGAGTDAEARRKRGLPGWASGETLGGEVSGKEKTGDAVFDSDKNGLLGSGSYVYGYGSHRIVKAAAGTPAHFVQSVLAKAFNVTNKFVLVSGEIYIGDSLVDTVYGVSNGSQIASTFKSSGTYEDKIYGIKNAIHEIAHDVFSSIFGGYTNGRIENYDKYFSRKESVRKIADKAFYTFDTVGGRDTLRNLCDFYLDKGYLNTYVRNGTFDEIKSRYGKDGSAVKEALRNCVSEEIINDILGNCKRINSSTLSPGQISQLRGIFLDQLSSDGIFKQNQVDAIRQAHEAIDAGDFLDVNGYNINAAPQTSEMDQVDQDEVDAIVAKLFAGTVAPGEAELGAKSIAEDTKRDIYKVASGDPGAVSDDGLRAVLEYTLDKLSPRTGSRTETIEERIANIYLSQSKFQDEKSHRDTNYLAYSKLNPNQQTDAFFVLDTVLKEIDSRKIGLSKPNKPTMQWQNTPLPADEDIVRIGSKLLADEMNAWRNEHADGTLHFEDLLKDGPRSERLKDFMNGNLQYGELWTASERRELIEDTFGVPCHLEGKRVVIDNESDLITAGVDNGVAGIYGAESHDFGVDEEASEESGDFRDESIAEIEENVDQGDLRRDLNALRKTSKAEAKGEKPGRNSNYAKGAIPTLPEQHGWVSTFDENEDYSEPIQELLYDAQYLEKDIDILNRRIAAKEQRGDYDSIKSDLKKLAELKRKLTITNKRLNGLERLSKNAEARTKARERARSEAAEEKEAEARRRELGISREQIKYGRRLSQEEIDKLKQNASKYEASRPSEERNSETRNDELAHLSREETERLFPGGYTQVPGKTTRFNESYEPGAKETSTIPAENSPEISERNRQASSEARRSRGESVNTDNISAETLDRRNEMFSERLGIKNTGNTAVATGTPAGIAKDSAPQNALETSDEFDAVNTGNKLVSDKQLQEQQTSNEHDVKFTDEQKENKLIPKKKKPSGYTVRDNEIGVWMSPDVFAKTSIGKEMEAHRSEFDALKESRQGYYDKYDLPGISRASRGLKDPSGYRANRSAAEAELGESSKPSVTLDDLFESLQPVLFDETGRMLFDENRANKYVKEQNEKDKKLGGKGEFTLETFGFNGPFVSPDVADSMRRFSGYAKDIEDGNRPVMAAVNMAKHIQELMAEPRNMGWLLTKEVTDSAEKILKAYEFFSENKGLEGVYTEEGNTGTLAKDYARQVDNVAESTAKILAAIATRSARTQAQMDMAYHIQNALSFREYDKKSGYAKQLAEFWKSHQLNPADGFKMLDNNKFYENGPGYQLARMLQDGLGKEQTLTVAAQAPFQGLRKEKGFDTFASNKKSYTMRNGISLSEQEAVSFIMLCNTLYSQKVWEDGNGKTRSRLNYLEGLSVADENGKERNFEVKSLLNEMDKGSKKKYAIEDILLQERDAMMKELSPAARKYIEIAGKVLNDIGKQVSAAKQSVTGVGFDVGEPGNFFPVEWYENDHDRVKPRSGEAPGIFDRFVDRGTGNYGYLLVKPAAKVVDDYLSDAIYAASYGDLADTLSFLDSGYMGNKSLTTAVEESYGRRFADVFGHYVDDVNRVKRNGRFASSPIFGEMRKRLQTGALSFSLSVPIKQVASYWDAAGVISPQALLSTYRFKGPGVKMKGGAVGQAAFDYRSIGNWDPTMSEILGNDGLINSLKKENSIKRGIALATNTMDLKAVDNLFTATVLDTKMNFPDVDVNSDTFQKLVSAKFQEVVLRTQPVFNKNARAEYMRTNNELERAASMFRTQQTQNFNKLLTTIGEYKAAKGTKYQKMAAKELRQTVTGQLAGAIEFGLLSIVADFARHKLKPYRKDEDDDTIDPWKIAGRWGLNSLFSASGTGWFVDQAAKALVDIAMGDKSESSGEFYGLSLGPISTFLDSTSKLVKDAGTIVNAIREKDFSGISINTLRNDLFNAATVTGAPVNNIANFVSGAAMYALDAVDAATDHRSVYGNRGVYDNVFKMFDDILHGKYTQVTAQHQADKFFRKGDAENLLYNVSILSGITEPGQQDKGYNYLVGKISPKTESQKDDEIEEFGRSLTGNERIANYLVSSNLSDEGIDEAIASLNNESYNTLYNAIRHYGVSAKDAVEQMLNSDGDSSLSTRIYDDDTVEGLLSGKQVDGPNNDIPALSEKNLDEYTNFVSAIKVFEATGDYGALDKVIADFDKLDSNTQAVLLAKNTNIIPNGSLKQALECRQLGISSEEYYKLKGVIKQTQHDMNKSTNTGTAVRLVALGNSGLSDEQIDALLSSDWMKISKTGKACIEILHDEYGFSLADVGKFMDYAATVYGQYGGTGLSNAKAAAALEAIGTSKLKLSVSLTNAQKRAIYAALKGNSSINNSFNNWYNYNYAQELNYIHDGVRNRDGRVFSQKLAEYAANNPQFFSNTDNDLDLLTEEEVKEIMQRRKEEDAA